MTEYVVRIATRSEIKQVTGMLIAERSKFPSFSRLISSPWKRFIYERWVTPRYLRSSANTFVLLQDGKLAGYAVAEQGGETVHLADVSIQRGYDRIPLFDLLIQQVEAIAVDRDYRYVRASPWEIDADTLALFESNGYRLLDYFVWAFAGEVKEVKPPEGLVMTPLRNKENAEKRAKYLEMDLAASDVEEVDLIRKLFLRRRLPPYRAFTLERDGVEIGYLSPRYDERGDGVLTLVISLDPSLWGTDFETSIIGGFLSEAQRGKEGSSGSGKGATDARVVVSTARHADMIEEAMAAIGLHREMDLRPVYYKNLR